MGVRSSHALGVGWREPGDAAGEERRACTTQYLVA